MNEHVSTDEAAEAAPNAASFEGSTIPAEELDRISGDIVLALKTVYDPEIPADIYELGLIYKVDIDDDRQVTIDMTLTTPNCPSALPPEEIDRMTDDIVAALKTVYDPEIPADIYELGLI